MSELRSLLAAHKQQLLSAPRVLVGYSGGLDSSVLLHAIAELLEPSRVLAVHINHQISSESDKWERHCQAAAEELNVGFYSEKVSLPDGGGTEERARDLRYEIFSRLLGKTEILLLGHHRDDQVETFLFRLFRGSGVKGLAAMPERRALGDGYILRPLLSHSKKVLKESAESTGLDWVEDLSNADNQFDRNFLRNKVIPIVKERWPSMSKQVLSAAETFQKTDTLLTEIAELDIAQSDFRKESLGVSISIEAINSMSKPRKENLLRRFIYRCQGTQPGQDVVDCLETEVLGASEDAQPKLKIGKVDLQRFKGRLYLTPSFVFDHDPKELFIEWPANEASCEVAGLWRVERMGGPEQPLKIGFRRGGERATPNDRTHSQTLKKLMLEYEIEPWLRDILPVIYQEEEIVAIGDRIQCADFRFQMHWLIEENIGFG